MIVLATNEFPPIAGGVGTYCLEVCRALHNLGYRVTVVAADKGGNRVRPFDKTLPFPIRRVVEHRYSVVRHSVRTATIFATVAQVKPAVLWAADWRSALGFLPSINHRGQSRFAVMSHGSEVLLARRSLISRRLAQIVYNHADVILTNSHYTSSLLTDFGVSPAKIVITGLGVDLTAWEVDPQGRVDVRARHNLGQRPMILSLARLTPRKGHDALIRAMPYVRAAIPDSVCVIAGSGDDIDRLRSLVAELGLEQAVVFAGYIAEAEKPAYYQACDIYTMLSRQDGPLVEGFGITLLEAAACAKPVVAGHHGGVAEAVISHETGLLVDPLDSLQVAQALISLLREPIYADQLGQQARRRVQQVYTWEAVAQRTLTAFGCLSERSLHS